MPTLIDTGPSRRGWHRLERALRCMQDYADHVILGYRDESDPLVRGTLGHVGMAHYYQRLFATQHGYSPDAFYTPVEAVALKAQQMGAIGEKHLPKIQAAVAEYERRFAQERLEIVAVEQEVEMYFGPHLVTQRLDLVVKDRAGKLWTWDHKFVGAIYDKTVARYALSGQFLLMNYMGRHVFGDAFGGVRLNLIAVDKLQFIRESPPPSPDALQRFPQCVADAEALIASCEGRDPTNYPRANSELVCMTPYGFCPCYERCRWGRSATG